MGSQTDPAMTIGFAGLGAMGMGMATNLVQAGYSVSGFDIVSKALETFAARGGRPSPSLAEASLGRSKFFVMVASPQHVDHLVPGLTAALPQGAILCLFSTLPAAYVVELNDRLRNMGRPDLRLLDCPVSGGVVGANAGALTIMLSGDDEALKEIQPELDIISAPGRLFHAGPLGSASTIKMLNQHLAGSHVVAAAETLAFAKALGLSSREAYKILTRSEGASWIMRDRGVSMLNGDFTPKSAVTIFTKDMGIVNAAADNSLIPCPIASTAYQVFMERAARGHGRDDDASVVCNYEDITGCSVCEPLEDSASAPVPSATSPVKHRPVALVVEDERLADPLDRSLVGDATSTGETLRIVRVNRGEAASALRDISPDVLVGVPGRIADREQLRKLSSSFPEHQVFDYQAVYSDDFTSLQILMLAGRSCSAPRTTTITSRPFSGNAWAPISRQSQSKGAPGSSSAVYSAVRYGSLIHAAAAAECYALASAQGVSVELLYNLISGAAGSSAQFNQAFPKMISQDFSWNEADGVWSLSEAIEDLGALKRVAQDMSFPGRMLDAAHQMFKSVSQEETAMEKTSIAALTLFWSREPKAKRARL